MNLNTDVETSSHIASAPAATPTTDLHASNRVQPGRVLMTRVGLQIPANLSFEDWERAGCQLSGIVDSSSWWLGDWLVYGKKHYSDRYKRAIRAANLQYQTLRNYAWVARRFELSRRRASLSFQHHAEVASLPHDEQELWLDQAEQAMWTTKQLRIRIRNERIDVDNTSESPALIPRIEVADLRLSYWRKAAEQIGIEFENWVLSTLDYAAGQTLGEEFHAPTTKEPQLVR
jgi:hypothetical protein